MHGLRKDPRRSPTVAGARTWPTEADCDFEAFRLLVEQCAAPADHPSAERVEENVPLYDSGRLRSLAATPESRRSVQDELARALLDGPGIVVLKGAEASTLSLHEHRPVRLDEVRKG
ncbi:hypothetical protein AB0N16_31295 [Streptomyces sp. NPDC051105]|uniref:hypothetical protein n=1 Tax=Streptomyces sp. NPDC051105 TaxID=3154843 RepID=UPI00341DF076